jgi:hypothetical protein
MNLKFTRGVFGEGRGIQCIGLTSLPPPGAVRACPGLCRDSCDEVKIIDKCTYSEGSKKKLPVRT